MTTLDPTMYDLNRHVHLQPGVVSVNMVDLLLLTRVYKFLLASKDRSPNFFWLACECEAR